MEKTSANSSDLIEFIWEESFDLSLHFKYTSAVLDTSVDLRQAHGHKRHAQALDLVSRRDIKR